MRQKTLNDSFSAAQPVRGRTEIQTRWSWDVRALHTTYTLLSFNSLDNFSISVKKSFNSHNQFWFSTLQSWSYLKVTCALAGAFLTTDSNSP